MFYFPSSCSRLYRRYLPLTFAVLFLVFPLLSSARAETPQTLDPGYAALKKIFSEKFQLEPRAKCLPHKQIQATNCLITIVELPTCKEDWGWDFVVMRVDYGNESLSLQAFNFMTESKQTSDVFEFIQYDRESEEGHKTGPIFELNRIKIKGDDITFTIYPNHPEYAETVTCHLSSEK